MLPPIFGLSTDTDADHLVGSEQLQIQLMVYLQTPALKFALAGFHFIAEWTVGGGLCALSLVFNLFILILYFLCSCALLKYSAVQVCAYAAQN